MIVFYADDGGVNYQKWFFWGDLREAPQHSLHRACVVHLLLIIYKNVEKVLNTPFFFLVLSTSFSKTVSGPPEVSCIKDTMNSSVQRNKKTGWLEMVGDKTKIKEIPG